MALTKLAHGLFWLTQFKQVSPACQHHWEVVSYDGLIEPSVSISGRAMNHRQPVTGETSCHRWESQGSGHHQTDDKFSINWNIQLTRMFDYYIVIVQFAYSRGKWGKNGMIGIFFRWLGFFKKRNFNAYSFISGILFHYLLTRWP